ncbi:MAG TPA: protein kinase [Candidatus Acidoferrum sp.]|nr:protein kinase [Candidatus Acidoferrum sp.]
MQQLGKYEIIAEIGRGAMGAVYKARDPLIDRLVALKTITGGPSAQKNLLDRFYQEARSAGALQHPNIVTIYELGHEKNTPFIAMEFLEGESLDRIIEQKPVLPLSVKLGYIVRVCEALSFAHAHNVIHRDVKPGNVMVTKDGVVKVVDFGIARLTDMSMTQPNMMIGSRAYMSPQLYKGERADARSDIWAVGVTLYELLAYRRPFIGDSEAELMFHIIYEKPDDLMSLSPECTEGLVPIVEKMLEKKSEDRYQSLEDVLHDLEPIWKAAQQATVSGLLADCKELVQANDLQRAQALLRKALHIDVGNSQAKSMLEKVSVELRRSEIQPRLKELLGRGEELLKAGQLREAKHEAEAALGLDSKHEPAQKLLGEIEAAAARAQQLEQRLKLTKQRLAEGALTEAAAALGQALEMDDGNPQAQELKRQIDEERNRREKRKKLSEILHRARTLWTELNYDECLAVLSEAMQEFPNEPELKKLQETARTDVSEQSKQRRMAEVRKLLGQQNFLEARKTLDVLVKDHPEDTAIKNLQNLALQEEQEQNRQKKLESEITVMRGLLGAGKFKQVVAKGEPLLQEFPQEYELKELINYARGEASQQEQKRKEEEREKQIQGFLMCERYAEALDTARKAMAEFPKQDAFRKLAKEAEALKKEQDDRDKARNEMQRRVREINSKIGQEKMTDAIDLAQQTMEAMGPDPNVTQLLHSAEDKKKQKDDQEQKVAALQTMVDRGDHAGATQLYNQVMATQIFQPNDPRIADLRGKILALASGQHPAATQLFNSKTAAAKPPATAKTASPGASKPAVPARSQTEVSDSAKNIPVPDFSATRVMGPGQATASSAGGKTKVPPQPGTPPVKPDSSSATVIAASASTPRAASSANIPAAKPSAAGPASRPATPAPAHAAPSQAAPGMAAQILPILRHPAVLAGAGVVVVALLAVAVWPHIFRGGTPSAKDLQQKQEAQQLWDNRQFDQSEQAWQGIAAKSGPLQKEAEAQVAQIEQKRKDEQAKFDQAEDLLKNKKDFAGAQQAFQDVIQMNLWHSAEASREMDASSASLGASDLQKQEQDHFDQGVKLFEAKDYEKARKEFRAIVDLNVAGSTLKQQAENYLGRIRQTANEQKLFDTAMQDVQAENWSEAQDQFQEVIKRKGSQSNDAKKQLPTVQKALQTIAAAETAIRGGAFRDAKTQVDSAQHWSKTHDKLSKELHAAEQQQFEQLRSSAQLAESKGDAAGIQRAQDEIHRFEGRAEEPSILAACRELDKHLNSAYSTAVEKTSDKSAFETAVAHFEQAKQRGDVSQLSHGVSQEFQKIANGAGIYREQAALYVKSTIPNTIQSLTKSEGKLVLPALNCGSGRPSQAIPSVGGAVSCAQLDANSPLEWVGTPMVDFPDEAKKPGKLPYTLTVLVTVEANGNVKVDKEGNADKEFFKKVKDASKHWRTTTPKSGGKAVSVRFPLTITFQH